MNTMKTKSPAKTYPEHERANIMFYLVYGLPILDKYDADDSVSSCRTAVKTWSKMLFTEPNSNPLRRKYRNLNTFMNWFDQTYPRNSLAYLGI